MAIGILVSRGLTRRVPLTVDDAETTVRAIFSPYHLKKDKLQPQAFSSPPGSDEVSVSRRWYVYVWLAKAYAKRWVQSLHSSPPKAYRGFAIVEVSKVREIGSNIVDSRIEYLGHADITHGVIQEKGVALQPHIRKKLDERLRQLSSHARFVEDVSPNSWRPPGRC